MNAKGEGPTATVPAARMCMGVCREGAEKEARCMQRGRQDVDGPGHGGRE